MPIVAKNNDVLVVIDIYSVESSRQQGLVGSLINVVAPICNHSLLNFLISPNRTRIFMRLPSSNTGLMTA